MEQRRELNKFLLVHRRRRHHRHHHGNHDDNDEAAFSGVVVVKETGTCSGHVTDITQRLDDIDETSSNMSSLVMSTSSDNGLDSLSSITCSCPCIQGGPAKVRPTYIFDGNI